MGPRRGEHQFVYLLSCPRKGYRTLQGDPQRRVIGCILVSNVYNSRSDDLPLRHLCVSERPPSFLRVIACWTTRKVQPLHRQPASWRGRRRSGSERMGAQARFHRSHSVASGGSGSCVSTIYLCCVQKQHRVRYKNHVSPAKRFPQRRVDSCLRDG